MFIIYLLVNAEYARKWQALIVRHQIPFRVIVGNYFHKFLFKSQVSLSSCNYLE